MRKRQTKYKTYGDIITANIYRIEKGMPALAAEDYTTGEPVTIPLDITLSPSANAQKNYKKYNKLKSSLDITAKNGCFLPKKILHFLKASKYHLTLPKILMNSRKSSTSFTKQDLYVLPQPMLRRHKKPSAPHKIFIIGRIYHFCRQEQSAKTIS